MWRKEKERENSEALLTSAGMRVSSSIERLHMSHPSIRWVMLCPNKGHHIFYFVLSGCLPSHEERPLHLFEKDNNSALSDVGMIARNQAMTSSNLVLLEEKDKPRRTEKNWALVFFFFNWIKKHVFVFFCCSVSYLFLASTRKEWFERPISSINGHAEPEMQSLNLHIRKWGKLVWFSTIDRATRERAKKKTEDPS